MNLSDDRLTEIKAWLCGESPTDPLIQNSELASMARELQQLRLRTSSKSRTSGGARAAGH